MVKIKVCGLRRLEDIAYANELQVDYAGFVFAPSPRQVNLSLAKKLVANLATDIQKVGVFVNENYHVVNEVAKELQLDIVQLHGSEPPETMKYYTPDIWKAIRVQNLFSLEEALSYQVNGILLDTAVKGRMGGTGQTFNWNLTKEISLPAPLILAGGLNPDNVEQAIASVNPFAVDVSSGVETNGCKDYVKLKTFIERVRAK
ncbi:phosphoribosylanthranilate isomerase [Bacillota bacterium LX-D]|nr:phosphoribosylanthranilate isomerase [Bacillota bacterium LX-D]